MAREETQTHKAHVAEDASLHAIVTAPKQRSRPRGNGQRQANKPPGPREQLANALNEKRKLLKVKNEGGSGPVGPDQSSLATTFGRDGAVEFDNEERRLKAARLGLVLGPNDITESTLVQVGAQLRADVNLGAPWVNTVFNGVVDGDCRFPDPFTLVKTSITQIVTAGQWSAQALSFAPGTNDYGEYGFLFGSGVASLGHFSSISTSTSSFDTSTSSSLTFLSGGMNSTDLMSRPNGCVLTIKPQLIGPAHSCFVCAFPINPCNQASIRAMGTVPTGWPRTVTSLRQSISAQQSMWGGRFWEFHEGDDAIKLVSLPVDSRCLDFGISNVERDAMYIGDVDEPAVLAWTGWVFWVYGCTAVDKITYKLNFCEETMLRTLQTTIFPYPQSLRKTSSVVRDGLINTAANAVQSGLNGIKLGDKVMDLLKGAGNAVFRKLKGIAGGMIPELFGAAGGYSGIAPGPEICVSMRKKTQVRGREEKVDVPELADMPLKHLSESTKTVNALTDEPEIVTPHASRRPSLALSLSARKK